MRVEESYALAHKILRKSGGCQDPEIICKCLGIELFEYDLGNLKGMYSSADRHRTIFLNKRLTGYLRRFVLAHEIGHDQILEHRKQARSKPYKEVMLFQEGRCFKDDQFFKEGQCFKDDQCFKEGQYFQHFQFSQFSCSKNNTEREANSVAAHLLINDVQMLTLAKEGRTLQQIAVELCVPEDLLLIELEDYGKLHPDFLFRLPRIPKGNYLKDYTDGTF